MNKEQLKGLVFSRKHVEENVGHKAQSCDTKKILSSAEMEDSSEEEREQSKTTGGEPPVDWFEPLEEDNDSNDDDDDDEEEDHANSVSKNDPEDESLAGESERSESMAGSEKAFKKTHQLHAPRRKRSRKDEGWLECPALGQGWKRREVIRRSGSSVGQKDIYYLSPTGDRVRSKVELLSVLGGIINLSNFDFKSGIFCDGYSHPVRVRKRMKKKVRERSSSESSFMDRGDGADTPDSNHRLTPAVMSLNAQLKQTSYSLPTRVEIPNQVTRHEGPPVDETIKLPVPSSSRLCPLPSINGEIGTEDSPLVCARCAASFTGTWYDKQRKRPCCPTCWASSKTKEHPMIRFRKWIPCGQCLGCVNRVNCGECANCKHGLQSPESRKRLCRKRKCICPIRKDPGSVAFVQSTYNDMPETYDDTCMSFQSEVTDSQLQSLKSSDTENFSANVDVDDEDDFSTDDDDDWHKKRKRRSCGECKACMCRKDCGTCDFCVDKPKFGGSNKKRQKCRLRQCQRQAMRHLLPFQMGQGDYGPDGPVQPGRPRPYYTYTRKLHQMKKIQGPQFNLDYTDNEDDDSCLQEQLNHSDFIQQNGLSDRAPYTSNQLDQRSKWSAESSHTNRNVQNHIEQEAEDEDDDEELPMITQIFSLADQSAVSGGDAERQLMKLLQSLRTSVLPILWYAIVVEGPQLQLIQCCKKSSMIDTMVLIDPGFCYQVTVQKQPLLPTHPLYDSFPARLTSVTEVVSLLLGLEKYVVCQGLSPKNPHSNKNPVILERASTCDFLVNKDVSVCSGCQGLQGI